jgi:hypothetical protein
VSAALHGQGIGGYSETLYDRAALWQCFLAGLRAAKRGEAAETNPRNTEPERSAWSQGHRYGSPRLDDHKDSRGTGDVPLPLRPVPS